MAGRSDFPWRLLADVLCGSSVVTFLALAESGVIPSTKVGFFCDDPALSLPYSGDTISMTILLSTTALVPIFMVWFVETLSAADYELSLSTRKRSERGARVAAIWYKEYLLGLGLVLLITDFAKLLVGEPRPHFLETCAPDAALNCSSGYVADFNCTNTKYGTWFVQDATKSFPSGHASISFYTSLFLMWFLQCRLPRTSWLLLPWLQSLCLLWALICSLTRVTDHRHHWWDVLAGVVLGITIAVFTVQIFCKGFAKEPSIPCTDIMTKEDTSNLENCHIAHNTYGNGRRHQSVRRLLSSTSSYTGDISTEEQEMRDTL